MVMIQTQAKLIMETETYQLLGMEAYISNWKEEKANHLETPFLPEFYRDKNP